MALPPRRSTSVAGGGRQRMACRDGAADAAHLGAVGGGEGHFTCSLGGPVALAGRIAASACRRQQEKGCGHERAGSPGERGHATHRSSYPASNPSPEATEMEQVDACAHGGRSAARRGPVVQPTVSPSRLRAQPARDRFDAADSVTPSRSAPSRAPPATNPTAAPSAAPRSRRRPSPRPSTLNRMSTGSNTRLGNQLLDPLVDHAHQGRGDDREQRRNGNPGGPG